MRGRPEGGSQHGLDDEDAVSLAYATLDRNTAEEIATVYSDQVVFPHAVVVERSTDVPSHFPTWNGRVLVIAHENQGVCSWGLSLDGPSSGAVLVGGTLPGGLGTVVYSASLAEYVRARRWDTACLTSEPLLQAQAASLDDTTVAELSRSFREEGLATYGWPCPVNRRFRRGAVLVMLWICEDQCDWWISGPAPALSRLLPDLRVMSDLRRSLWSNDDAGSRLLAEA